LGFDKHWDFLLYSKDVASVESAKVQNLNASRFVSTYSGVIQAVGAVM
jgi:hypothetical protein